MVCVCVPEPDTFALADAAEDDDVDGRVERTEADKEEDEEDEEDLDEEGKFNSVSSMISRRSGDL